MFMTPSKLAEIQKDNFEALGAIGRAAIDASEKFARLSLATSKSLLNDSTVVAQNLSGVKDVQELVAVASGSAQPAIDKWVGYSRAIYDIASGVGSELSKVVEAQVAGGNRQLVELVEAASKNGPAGTESAVAWIKSAVATTQGAVDAMSRAAKQGAEAVESNFAAATEAAYAGATKGRARKFS